MRCAERVCSEVPADSSLAPSLNCEIGECGNFLAEGRSRCVACRWGLEFIDWATFKL